jgi:hypothetical protein
MQILKCKRIAALSIVVLFLFTSCGGGSSIVRNNGQITGRVLNHLGEPLSGVVVTALEGGESGTTGEQGRFTFETYFDGQERTLLVNFQESPAQVDLGNIPSEAFVFVELAIEVSDDGIVVQLVDLAIAQI